MELIEICFVIIPMTFQNKYQGCLIGLALGDAVCAPFEGGILERFLWKFFSSTKTGEIRFTDDTQMTIDIARSLIAYQGINQDALADQFASSYQWSRGYGPTAAKLLKAIKKGHDWRTLNTKFFKEGSFGNGAAMRIAPIALFYPNNSRLMLHAVKQSSVITHAHPDAIDGAKIIAQVLVYMLNENEGNIFEQLRKTQNSVYQNKLKTAQKWLTNNHKPTTKEVAKQLGNGIQAINSTVTAVYLALRFIGRDYNKMIEFIQKLKGDTDTIAAMAGAIWGAKNGLKAIKHPKLKILESKNEIIELADSLYYLSLKTV